MCSLPTPPPPAASTPSLIIWWAATVIACKPEEQKRLMVVPATDAGSPASMAEVRAIFWPCAPWGWAQPRTKSSISFASSFGVLSKTSLMQCAARSSGRVRLKDPRKDLARGVRELATTTASLIYSPAAGMKSQIHENVLRQRFMTAVCANGKLRRHAFFLAELGECLALLCKALQQRGGPPDIAVLTMEFGDALVNFLEADGVGIPHGTAAECGKAVAVQINNVDVRSAQRIALLQNARPFFNQGIDAAICDFFGGD